MPPRSKAIRPRLADDLESRYEKAIAVLDAALVSKKKVSVSRNCPKCGCKHLEYAEVDDVNGAIKALEFFANQGLGRPGEDRSADGGGDFVVKRFVVEPDEKNDSSSV